MVQRYAIETPIDDNIMIDIVTSKSISTSSTSSYTAAEQLQRTLYDGVTLMSETTCDETKILSTANTIIDNPFNIVTSTGDEEKIRLWLTSLISKDSKINKDKYICTLDTTIKNDTVIEKILPNTGITKEIENTVGQQDVANCVTEEQIKKLQHDEYKICEEHLYKCHIPKKCVFLQVFIDPKQAKYIYKCWKDKPPQIFGESFKQYLQSTIVHSDMVVPQLPPPPPILKDDLSYYSYKSTGNEEVYPPPLPCLIKPPQPPPPSSLLAINNTNSTNETPLGNFLPLPPLSLYNNVKIANYAPSSCTTRRLVYYGDLYEQSIIGDSN